MPRASSAARGRRLRAPSMLLAALALLAAPSPPAGAAERRPAAAPGAEERPLAWPEEQRAFFQDGPALLLPADQRAALLTASPVERQAAIDAFLDRDPVPETAADELRLGIERRRELVMREIGTFSDDRARLLFLHGRPLQRLVVDCASVFRPLEHFPPSRQPNW